MYNSGLVVIISAFLFHFNNSFYELDLLYIVRNLNLFMNLIKPTMIKYFFIFYTFACHIVAHDEFRNYERDF